MSQSMDDNAKALLFMEVQERHMAAMTKTMPGTANEATVREFKAIYDDYDRLLQLGAPEYPLYSLTDVQYRMADVLGWIARTYDSMRDTVHAHHYYEQAVAAFEELGDRENAARNRQNIAQLRFDREGDVDEETRRLRAKLSTVPEGSLQHATALIELGELYMRAGDDFASEEHLRAAIDELESLGYPDPSGEDPKAVLDQSVKDIMSGKATAGATQIEALVAVRGAYQRIYQCLRTIYKEREDLEEAAKYSKKYGQLTASELTEKDIAQAFLNRSGEA